MRAMSTSTDSDAGRGRHRPDRRQSVQALLEETDEALQRGARPGAQVWPTGFDLLDSTLDGGLRSGELVLLGGTEGAGKTTMAVQMVRNAVRAGRHAVVFSFEHDVDRPCSSASSPSRPPWPRSRRGSTPPPPPTSTPCARSSRPRTPTAAASPTPSPASPTASRRSTTVQEYAPRLHLHESDKTTTPDEIARIVAAVTEKAGEPPMVLIDYLQKMPIAGSTGDEIARVTIVTESLKDM